MDHRLRRKWLTGLTLMVIAAIVTLMALSPTRASTETASSTAIKETTAQLGRVTAGVTESGTVSIGTHTQKIDFTSSADNSSSSTSGTTTPTLVVESVLARAGQVLKAGDPLLSLTAESIAAVRLSLSEAVRSAEAALTSATIERDKSKIQAEYDLQSNHLLGTTAQAIYDATVAQLNINVADAERAIADANARIAAIPGDIADLEDEIDDLDDDTESARIYSLQQSIDDLKSELADLKASLPALELKKAKAERDRESGLADARKTLSANQFLASNAQKIYKNKISSLNDAVTAATASLDTAKANLADFESMLSGQQVLSHYAGTLTTLDYAAGDTISPGADLAVIQDPAAVTVEVDVAQDDVSLVEIGKSVHVEFSAYPEELWEGTVTAIAASVTNMRTATVSYPVTVTLSGDTSKIYDGMTGNVTFITHEVTDVVYVSNKAIINEGAHSYVQRKNADGSIEKVEVVTGFSNGYQVEIKSGLAAGDVVLIESQVKAS